jgi:hypothetical protein
MTVTGDTVAIEVLMTRCFPQHGSFEGTQSIHRYRRNGVTWEPVPGRLTEMGQGRGCRW